MSIKKSYVTLALISIIGLSLTTTATASWTDYLNPFNYFASATQTTLAEPSPEPVATPTPMSEVGADPQTPAKKEEVSDVDDKANSADTSELVTVNTYPFTSSTGASLEDMLSGTTLLVGASQDDVASSLASIGFDFWFDGVRNTQFSANSNGLIRLGGTVISGSATNDLATATNVPQVTAYWDDLCTDATGKVHYKVVGSAPSRKLVVEFNNMRTYNVGCTAGSLLGNYQVWIYEAAHATTPGLIELVYGSIPVNPNLFTGYSAGIGSTSSSFASITTSGPTASFAVSNNTQLTAISSGTKYAFTPVVLTAPGALSFTAVSPTSMTLNWSDTNSSPNEIGYVVYQSNDGGTTYSFVAQTAANAVSQTITGLTPSTNYFFRVFAVSEGALSVASAGNQATAAPGNISSVGAGGLWSAPATWVGGVVPTSTDNVTIVDGATVTVDVTTAACLSLTVGGGTSGILTYSSTVASTLTVGTSVTVSFGGAIQTAATGTITTHILDVAGNITNSGVIDLSTNTNTAGATLRFSGSGSSTYSGAGATNDLFILLLNKSAQSVVADLNLTNFTVRGLSTAATGALLTTAVGTGTLKFSGTNTFSGVLWSATGYTVSSTMGIWLNNPNFTVTSQSGSPTMSGLLRMTAGIYNVGVTTGQSMSGAGTSSFIIEGGTMNFASRLNVTSSGASFNMSAGTININTVANASANASFGFTSATSIFTMSGGTINLVQPNTTAPNLAWFVNTTAPTITGGTLNVGTAATATSFNFGIQGAIPNLVVDSTTNAKTATLTTGDVRVYRNITINTGASLNHNATTGFALFFFGTSVTNNGSIVGTAAATRFDFQGLGAQSYSGAGTWGTVAVPFVGVGVGISNTNNVTLSSPIITTRVNLFTGQFVNSNQITIGSGLALACFVQRGGGSGAAGTFDVAPTFNLGTGTYQVTYTTATNAVTTSVEIPASRALTFLTINNTNGVTLAGGGLTVGSGVTGTLTMTLGNLITSSSNLLTIGSTATAGISGGTTASYVSGPMARTLPASLVTGSTYTFPIGKTTYNLYELVNPTTGAGGTLVVQAEAFDANSGGTPGTGMTTLNTNRYWSAATSGAGALTAAPVRVNESPLTGNRLGQSTTLGGTYNSIGSTVVGTTVAGTASPLTLGFFNLGTFTLAGGTYSVCDGGTYPTLKSFFDAVNSSTLTGNVIVNIAGDCAETTTATLNQWSESPANSNYTMTIQPSGGFARTVSGAITAGSPLIDLNGADRVTIDGLNLNGNSLTISNTTNSTTTGTSTIRFVNDASGNTVTNSTISGSYLSTVINNGGTILFSGTNGATGNDSNTISNNNIGPAGVNLPTTSINFGGASNTDPGTGNSGNTVSGNNIFDYFGSSLTSAGIYVASGTPNGTFSNNRFYQTATRTQTTGAQHSAIWINNSSGNGYQVTGNTIGFGAGNGTGIYTLVHASGSTFVPIFTSVGSTTATSVQGNAISGIAITGASSGQTSSSPLRAIYVSGGLVNVGNTTANTFGSMAANGSVSYTTSGGNTDVFFYMNNGFAASNISNNNIGGITVGGSAVSFSGIYLNTSTGVTATVQNNTIGSALTDSILNNSTTSTATILGIRNNSSSAPALTATGNIIRNMTLVSPTTGTGSSASIIGIIHNNSTPTPNDISRNQIYNLSNTNATAAVSVTGIFYGGSTTVPNTISRNLIYGLNASSTATTSNLSGIVTNGGATTYSNNVIRLGTAGSSLTTGYTINGISDGVGTNNFYFNSVYIGGTGVVSASNTFAFNSLVTSSARIFRNNIFQNARSNASGAGKNYAVQVGGSAANPTGLTINNNDYFANGTGGMLGRFNALDVTTLTIWQTGVGQDANSVNSDPLYVAPTAATPDLHISSVASPVNNTGAVIAGITNDYDNDTRDVTTPDIGADEITSMQLSGANVYSVLENVGGGVATITVTRTAGTAIAGSVTYTLTDTTASGGATCTGATDYVNTGGSVAFTIGQTSNTFAIPICPDSTFEPDETFSINLTTGTGSIVGSPATAAFTILNDDAAPTFTVIFDANGGSGTMTNQVANAATNLSTNLFTRTGYGFAGWGTLPAGPVVYANNASYPFTANATLYAQWTAQSQTLTFNSNGGSPVTAIIQDFGTAVTAPASPTRSGYTFGGWYIDDVTFVNAYTFSTMGLSTTIHAKWTAASQTLTFNSNGGSAVPAIIQDFGTAVTAPANPTRSAYTFGGWYTDDVTFLNAYTFSTMGLSTTIHAKWTAASQTLTFNSNGGSAVTAITQDFGTALSAPTDPTRTGYTFGGWYIDDVTFVNAYTFSTMGLSTTIHAKWTAASQTLTFNSNGGSPVTAITQDFGTALSAPANPTRTGYTFGGWFTDDVTFVNAYTFSTMGLSTTIYAKWTINQYTVTFNANGGTGTMVPQTRDYNDAANLTANAFTRTGYTFAGWNTVALGGGTAYADQASYPFTASVTLYAQWLDAVAPETTIDGPNPNNPTNSSSATFTFSGTDTGGSGVAGFQCQLDAGGYTACTSPTTYSSLGNGLHIFYVRAIDNAGNVDASPATFSWVVDTIVPDTTIVTNPSNPSNSSSASFVYSANGFGISPVYTYECSLDGGAFTPCPALGISYTGLSDGSHNFRVKATDTAGNSDASPASYTWSIDTVLPLVTAYIPVGAATPLTAQNFTVSASDNVALASVVVRYSVNGAAAVSATCSLNTNCVIPGLALGDVVTYFVRATDTAGNTSDSPAPLTNLYTVGAATIPTGSYEAMSVAGGSTLGGNVVVSGRLNLAGILSGAGFTTSLGCNASVTGAGATAYIDGAVKKDFCTVGGFAYPVGQGFFSPVDVTITALATNPSSLTVTPEDQFLTGFVPAQSLSRNWGLVETGDLTATLLFHYDDSDVNGTEANYRVWRRQDSGIINDMCGAPCVSSQTNALGPVAGVTTFSRWTGSGPLAPSAGEASVSGRVTTADGRGISNAVTVISGNSLQTPMRVRTGSFGYYTFENLDAGETYVITINSKRFSFTVPSRVVTVNDNVVNLDFVADPQ